MIRDAAPPSSPPAPPGRRGCWRSAPPNPRDRAIRLGEGEERDGRDAERGGPFRIADDLVHGQALDPRMEAMGSRRPSPSITNIGQFSRRRSAYARGRGGATSQPCGCGGTLGDAQIHRGGCPHGRLRRRGGAVPGCVRHGAVSELRGSGRAGQPLHVGRHRERAPRRPAPIASMTPPADPSAMRRPGLRGR